MSLVNITKKKFIYVTILGTFANVFLVSTLVEGIRDNIIKYNEIVVDWKNPKFVFPILFIFLFIFIADMIKKKFKLK